jgi:DNA-binding response OmpR family regulator
MSMLMEERSYRGEDLPGLGDNDPAPDYGDGRLEVRPAAFVAVADGEDLQLTPLELALLAELTRHDGAVRTRKQLIAAAWGPGPPVGARNVDVRIKRLRDKLAEHIPEVDYIHTHAGIGYRFQPRPKS